MNKNICILVVSTGLVLGGCGTVKPLPEDHFYRVHITETANAKHAPLLKGGLFVDRIFTDSVRTGRAIVYRNNEKPLELQRHHYHFWAEAPPRLVQNQLTAYLKTAKAADYVFSTRQMGDYRYRLTGRLIEFDRIVGNSPSSIVKLQFMLTQRGDSRPLLEKTYHTTVPSSGSDMHAFAMAMQQALAEVFEALDQDIQHLVKARQAAKL